MVVKINMTRISKHFIFFLYIIAQLKKDFDLNLFHFVKYLMFFSVKSSLPHLSNIILLQYLNANTLKKERNTIASENLMEK